MSEHCPNPLCGAPVITTPDGRLLEAAPHRLGIALPDGTTLTTEQAAKQAVGIGELVGRRLHRCPRPQQQGLFEDTEEASI